MSSLYQVIKKICLQPLDLAPFGPLKAKMETLSSAWHHQHPGEVLNKYTLMPNVAYQEFEEVFSNQELLQTGFRIAGLFPWNPKAVHWEKLTAATLYAKKTPQEGEAMEVTDEVVVVREVTDEVAVVREVTDEVAVVMDGAEEVVEVMEDATDVTDTALAVEDAHVSVRPLIQDVGTGADGGVPMEWAQDIQDPFSLVEGPVGLGEVNSRQTPEVSVPPAQVEDQVNIVPTGADIVNFVPEDGTNLEDIFPKSSHEEKVHLLQR